MVDKIPIVGSREWEYRYDNLAKILNNPRYCIKLNPAVEDFFRGESDLFYADMMQVKRSTPKVVNEIEGYRGFVADPVYAGTIIENIVVPRLRSLVHKKMEHLRDSEETFRLSAIASGKKDIYDRVFNFSQGAKEELRGELEEANIMLPLFQKEYMSLIRGILTNEKSRKLILPSNYLRDAQGVRNKIYQTYMENPEMIVGWNISWLCRLEDALVRERRGLKEIYDHFKPEIDNFDEIASKSKVSVIFPQPLGLDEVSGKILYENIIPSGVSPEEHKKVLDSLNAHFVKRRKSIISH